MPSKNNYHSTRKSSHLATEFNVDRLGKLDTISCFNPSQLAKLQTVVNNDSINMQFICKCNPGTRHTDQKRMRLFIDLYCHENEYPLSLNSTRMHFSRMRADRFCCCLRGGGVCLGVSAQGWGMSA